ncbi:receptor-type tyrosine-protein phosphatase mu [Lingula anatina]|uniref:Receptor-type tyrosine-protein phosphatase mu n=1 Tax=Lingula anatina TaxID=7574 RepID=A0A1S3HWF8_LINAN|nr:receptor-type tyrosine-protein phosphatase mu [Lingula anatina]|eukprot:XP_013390377.1 receptor-type tyrosine-protein phosphatase mu [Lingula anatina]
MTGVCFIAATVAYISKVRKMPRAKKKRREEKLKKDKRNLETSVRVMVFKNQRGRTISEFLQISQDKGLIEKEHQALTKIALEREMLRRDGKIHTKDSSRTSDLACQLVIQDKMAAFLKDTKLNPFYVDGYKNRNAYLVHTAPTRETLESFWDLVWTHGCQCILTLTPSFDYCGILCCEYWHVATAGGYHVEIQNTVTRADWIKRTISVRKNDCDQERRIQHYQAKSWERHRCPDPILLLNIRREVNLSMSHESPKGQVTPLLVHEAFNSIDKVGAYIAVDAILERMDATKSVQIFNAVAYLRKKNPRMLETVQNYQFVYATVATHAVCDDTTVQRKDLVGVTKFLAWKSPGWSETGFSKEFKLLTSLTPVLTSGECAAGFRSENLHKNRNSVLLPPDRCRPYLKDDSVSSHSDYINAVYINSFYSEQQFIVTEWPMQNTVVDLWRLLYDCQIPTLVILDHMDSRFDRWRYPHFWPGFPETEVHDGLQVTLTETRRYPNITTKTFNIRKNVIRSSHKWAQSGKYDMQATRALLKKIFAVESATRHVHTVRMFQLNYWPRKAKEEMGSILMLNNLVEEWLHKLEIDQGFTHAPVCIMSKDGVERCGVFCTVNIALNQLAEEDKVDIFSTVKLVKANRPELVKDEKEYLLCYELIKLAEQQRWGARDTTAVPAINVLAGTMWYQGESVHKSLWDRVCTAPDFREDHRDSLVLILRGGWGNMSTVNMENSTVFSTATTPDFVWTHERILWTCICGGGSFLVLTAVVLYTFWKIQMSPKVQKKRDDERHEREKKNIALQVRESVHYNSRAIPKSTVGKIFSNEKRIKNEHMALTRLALEREVIRRSGKNPLSTQEIADKACDLAVDEVRAEGFLKYTAMAPIRINGLA